MAKKLSRIARWTAAANKAQEAVQKLRDIQEEFEEWQGNLPENLQDSPTGAKLDEVCGLDIEGALETINEAVEADLPLGWGKD